MVYKYVFNLFNFCQQRFKGPIHLINGEKIILDIGKSLNKKTDIISSKKIEINLSGMQSSLLNNKESNSKKILPKWELKKYIDGKWDNGLISIDNTNNHYKNQIVDEKKVMEIVGNALESMGASKK